MSLEDEVQNLKLVAFVSVVLGILLAILLAALLFPIGIIPAFFILSWVKSTWKAAEQEIEDTKQRSKIGNS